MENLERILKELACHHRDKSDMMAHAINDRLTKSIETYYKELTDSFKFLAKKDSAKVLKNM